MDIQKEKEKNLLTIKNNFKQLQVLCSKVFKVAPQSNEVLMAREVAKFISYIGLGINPSTVDANADTVINEFFNQTKMLTDFSKFKNSIIYNFCTSNIQTLKACFYVYFIKRIESLKNYDALFYFEGENEPKKKSFFGALFQKGKEKAKQSAEEKLTEVGTKAAEDFGTWLANETGIGKSEGNGAKSGGQIYYVWKFFPNGPYAFKTQPFKEDISANFKKEWIERIEKDSGLSFDTTQFYFEKLFPKIHAGYYKNDLEFYADIKKMSNVAQNKALEKITQKKSFVKSLFSKIGF